MRRERGQIGWQSGISAEAIAADALRAEGFSILATRLRTPLGELDIVAASAEMLLIIEVKQRANLATAAAALTARQAQRILGATEWVLAAHPEWNRPDVRIDLIAVDRARQVRRLRDILRQTA